MRSTRIEVNKLGMHQAIHLPSGLPRDPSDDWIDRKFRLVSESCVTQKHFFVHLWRRPTWNWNKLIIIWGGPKFHKNDEDKLKTGWRLSHSAGKLLAVHSYHKQFESWVTRSFNLSGRSYTQTRAHGELMIIKMCVDGGNSNCPASLWLPCVSQSSQEAKLRANVIRDLIARRIQSGMKQFA